MACCSAKAALQRPIRQFSVLEFGSVVSSEDQNGWADFSFSFRQWLCFADSNYTSDLAHVEEHCDTVVTFKETPEGNETKARSCKLYAILAGILKNRPLRLLRQIPSNNLEAASQFVYAQDQSQEHGVAECHHELPCIQE